MQTPNDPMREFFGRTLTAGTPRQALGLTLVPLNGGAPGTPYVVAAEAFAAGLLTIGELNGGQVPQLVAHNRSDSPVLLVDGEHLEGARQNRVLNVSVLLAPRHDTVIPVTCVEQGRWHYEGRPDFVPSADFAFADLRATNKANVAASARSGRGRMADQGETWRTVASRHAEVAGAPARTGAMREAFDHRRSSLEELRASFPAPLPGQTGVVACVGGRPVAMDVFDRPATLVTLWDRLVSGYAMDALGAPTTSVTPGRVERFLHRAATALATWHEGVGLGMDVMLTGPRVVGGALVWGGAVVHGSVFTSGRTPASDPAPIAGPRERAAGRRHFHTSG